MHFKQLFQTVLFTSLAWLAVSCNGSQGEGEAKNDNQAAAQRGEVNVYTHRHYESDQQLFDQFSRETGIKVNVVSASADELIQRLELEGENSPADILITVDAGRLYRAKEKGLLQPVSSSVLNENIPSNFRDQEGQWYGLTYRARVLAYDKNKVDSTQLSTYKDLANPKWENQILVRSSDNIYNQSLMASIIAANGQEEAREWAEGIVNNMARSPKGGDRDQVKAIAAGQGTVAIVNTYYIGKMLNADDEDEVKAGEQVKIYFPNQEGRGTHINISGAGVTAHAPNQENAIKFLEFLSGTEAQEVFAQSNFEYPVKKDTEVAPLLKSWGSFKADTLSFSKLGELNNQAVTIFDQAGWK
jgi:iron(III) transport system substrate-binding protein